MKFLSTLCKKLKGLFYRHFNKLDDRFEIVIFGGSFNPPHIGHRQVLEHFEKYMCTYKNHGNVIWIMPSENPQKNNIPMDYISYPDKVKMTTIGLIDPFNSLGNREIFQYYQYTKSHYMIDILDWLEDNYRDENYKFSLLIGMDQLINFKTWKGWESILEKYNVYVVHRKGESIDDVPKDLLEKYKSIEIIPGELSPVPISSTQIRSAIQSGLEDELEKIRPWIHPEVLEYILSNHLYSMSFYQLPPSFDSK